MDMKNSTDLREWLARCSVVAILRGVRPEEVVGVCGALEEEGVAIVEVPLNSPEALRSVGLLAREFGKRMLVGAGTLTEAGQVGSVAEAGGRLVVTPHADVGIVRAAKAAGLMAAPGFFNPTEAFALLGAGADALKLFPAEVLGVGMLRAMRAVLPGEAMVIPVGGVEAGNAAEWMAAGAAGVGAGSSIYRPGDSAEVVRAKARGLVGAVRGGVRGDGAAA